MAVWKTDSSDRIYVVDVNMEKRSPEDIAKDAAMQIVELFDQLVKEKKEKDDQNTV